MPGRLGKRRWRTRAPVDRYRIRSAWSALAEARASRPGSGREAVMTHRTTAHGADRLRQADDRHLRGAVLDPVCGMEVVLATAAHTLDHNGQTYAFCSASCRERFRSGPTAYLAGGRDRGQPKIGSAEPASRQSQVGATSYTCPMHPEVRRAEPGGCPDCGMALEPANLGAAMVKTEYVCPMHPEIVRDTPGACPICGMSLEPRTVTLADEVNPELRDMMRRFWVSAALAVPVLLLAMSDMIPGQPVQRALPSPLMLWVQLVLSTPAVLWGGWPLFVRGSRSIVNRRLNMFTLISIGVGTAYFYRVAATLFRHLVPASFRTHAGEVPVYFEAAAVITAVVLLGQVLELRARSRTSSAIRGLLGLAPKTARVLREDGTETDVPLDQVKVGDRLRVRPGERVPVGARPRDAHGHHGRRRAGGDGRRPDQECRGPGGSGEGGYPRRRQDRDAHAGQAAPDVACRRSGTPGVRRPSARGEPRAGQRTSSGRRDRLGRSAEGSQPAGPDGIPVSDGKGRRRRRGGAAGSARQREALRGTRHRSRDAHGGGGAPASRRSDGDVPRDRRQAGRTSRRGRSDQGIDG